MLADGQGGGVRPDPCRAELLARADRLVALIDVELSAVVGRILAHPRLQALEALWRGTRWLAVDQEVQWLNDGRAKMAVK